MPTAYFITTHTDSVGPYVPLPEGETLTYETGETITVNVDTPTQYDELPVFLYWLITLRTAEDVPEITGGYVAVSPQPEDLPPGTMMIIVRATEVVLTELHNALFGMRADLGMYPNTDSIMPDEEPS